MYSIYRSYEVSTEYWSRFQKEHFSNISMVLFVHDTAQEGVMNALGNSLFHAVVNQT